MREINFVGWKRVAEVEKDAITLFCWTVGRLEVNAHYTWNWKGRRTLKLGGAKRGPPPSLSLVSCAISPIAKVNGDHDGPHTRQLDLFVIVYCKKIRDTSYNGV